MPLTEEGIKDLQDVIKIIHEEPKRLDMGFWGRKYYNSSSYPEYVQGIIPPCNTVNCIAGHIMLKDKPELMELSPSYFYDIMANESEGYARDKLGLTKEESERLFYVNGWPQPFRYAYEIVEFDSKKRARVAIDRIRHFINEFLPEDQRYYIAEAQD